MKTVEDKEREVQNETIRMIRGEMILKNLLMTKTEIEIFDETIQRMRDDGTLQGILKRANELTQGRATLNGQEIQNN